MEKNGREISIDDQIAYFDQILGDDTSSKCFIIAVPSDLGESTNHEAKDENQYQEALILKNHIEKKLNTDQVEILTDCFHLHFGECGSLIKDLDYLVFLHEFWEKEEEYIIENIRRSRRFAVDSINLNPSSMMDDEYCEIH